MSNRNPLEQRFHLWREALFIARANKIRNDLGIDVTNLLGTIAPSTPFHEAPTLATSVVHSGYTTVKLPIIEL